MDPMLDAARQYAEGKIQCQCGNQDWLQFIYIGTQTDPIVAGCKKCGSIYRRTGLRWIKEHDGPTGPVMPLI